MTASLASLITGYCDVPAVMTATPPAVFLRDLSNNQIAVLSNNTFSDLRKLSTL